MISEIKQKLKSAAAFLTILILLPYVASVFAGGGGSRTDAEKEQNAVKLKICGADGLSEDLEVSLQEYMAQLLASEMQKDSGEEALKAQAVLIRTNICRELSSGDKTLEINLDTCRKSREARTFGNSMSAVPGRLRIQKASRSGMRTGSRGFLFIRQATA